LCLRLSLSARSASTPARWRERSRHRFQHFGAFLRSTVEAIAASAETARDSKSRRSRGKTARIRCKVLPSYEPASPGRANFGLAYGVTPPFGEPPHAIQTSGRNCHEGDPAPDACRYNTCGSPQLIRNIRLRINLRRITRTPLFVVWRSFVPTSTKGEAGLLSDGEKA
jgi:hypothetical protein